jgi:YVTN family beta-propeller protein
MFRGVRSLHRRSTGVLVVLAVVVLAGLLHGPPAAAHRFPTSLSPSAGSVAPLTFGPSPAVAVPFPGTVRSTVLTNYNGSLAGNFRSTVNDLFVGAPVYVSANGTFWWPELPVAGNGTAAPPIAPTLRYNATEGRFVGLDPRVANVSAFVVDPGDGRIYAAQPATNSVAVISLSTGGPTGVSIPVGFDPVALGLDPSVHALFVVNHASDNVTVISTSTDRVTFDGIGVGHSPVAVAVDPTDGWVYVANANSGNLSVIDAAAPATPVTPVALTNGPADALALSPTTGFLAAASPSSAHLTIVDAATHTVASAAVPVGTNASGITVTSDGGTFVVANASGGTVRTVAASAPFGVGASPIVVGPGPTWLATDPLSGNVLVWLADSRTVALLNLSGPAVVAESNPLVSAPGPIAYDASSRLVFVADRTVPLVDSFDPLSGAVGGPPIGLAAVATAIAVDPANERLYVAEPNAVLAFNTSTGIETASAPLAGPNGPIAVDPVSGLLWVGRSAQDDLVGLALGTLALRATTGSIGTSALLPSSITVDPANGAVFVLNVSDLNSVRGIGGGSGAFLTPDIYCGPNATSLAFDSADGLVYVAGDGLTGFDPTTFDQPVWEAPIGAHAGVAAMTYDASDALVWVHTTDAAGAGSLVAVDGASAAASNGTYTVLDVGYGVGGASTVAPGPGPLGGGAFTLVANANSGTVSLIGRSLSLPLFTASPSGIDVGVSTLLSTSVDGGVGPVTLSFTGLPAGCVSASSAALSCVPTSAGSYAVTANGVDALGEHATANATVEVASALAVTATASSDPYGEADVGTGVTFNASGTGGTGTIGYHWSFSDGATASGPSVVHAFVSPGVVRGSVTANDNGSGVAFATVGLVVVPLPTVTIRALDPPSVDAGLAVGFAANVTGGVGPGTFRWGFDDGSANATGAQVTHVWGHAGGYHVTVDYTDEDGAQTRTVDLVTVYAPLGANVTVAPSPGGYTVGAGIDFTALVSGGGSPAEIAWSFGDGSNASGRTVNHAFAAPGVFHVALTVSDPAGAMVVRNVDVDISGTNGSLPSAPSGGFSAALVLGLVIGAAVATVALFLAERAKHRRPMRPPTPYPPPDGGPPKGT